MRERRTAICGYQGVCPSSEKERSGIELHGMSRTGPRAQPVSEMERSGIELTGEGESPVYACGKSVVEIFGIFQKYRTIFEL